MSLRPATRIRLPAGVFRPLLVVAALALIGVTLALAMHRADRELRAGLLQQARQLAEEVNLEAVRALTGTPADQATPAYQRLKEQLSKVRSSSPECRGIYLIGRRPDRPVVSLSPPGPESAAQVAGSLFFFVDSGPSGPKDYTPPGQVIESPSASLLRVFGAGSALVEGPVSDRWGEWITALVPLPDPETGAVLAVLGMNIDAREWQWNVTAKAALPTGLMLVLLIVAVAAVLSARPTVPRDTSSELAIRSPKPVLRRLLPPLTIMVVLLMAGAGTLLWQQHRLRLAGEIAADVTDVFGDLRTALEQQASSLADALQPIAADPTVQKALRDGDTDRLAAEWQPVFQSVPTQKHTPYFTFSNAKRVCLLRIREPAQRGDVINRFTALEAARTGRTASGIELGPMGALTLRVVQPVFEGVHLVGYVELEKDVEEVLQTLRTRSGNEVAVTLRKQYLNRQAWETGMRQLGRKADWDSLPRSVVIHASQGLLLNGLAPLAAHDGTGDLAPGQADGMVAAGGKSWRVASTPLQDVAGTPVGDLVIAHDITAAKAAFEHLMTLGGTAGAVLLALLLGFIYVLLTDTDTGIRAQQADLRESEEKHRLLFESAGDAIFIHDPQGRLLAVNSTACERLGYTHAELLATPYERLSSTAEAAHAPERLARLMELGHLTFETVQQRKDGSLIPTEVNARLITWDRRQVTMSICRDVAERKQAETYRDIGSEVLNILNKPGDLRTSLQRILASMKERTGFDAVGLRLQDAADFPYFAQQGLPEDFLLPDDPHLAKAKAGLARLDCHGKICLEGSCGLVLAGKTDPAKSHFSRGGSFWVNDSEPVREPPSYQDPRVQSRSQCINNGYASVALVPIRMNEEFVGVLQLSDHRKGCFSLSTIEQLEIIAAHLGEALMRKRAEEQVRGLLAESNEARLALLGILEDATRAKDELARSQAELKAVYDHAPVMMCVVDGEQRVHYANPAFAAFTGAVGDCLAGDRACGAFGCINALDELQACGFGQRCPNCALLRAMQDTLQTGTEHHNIEHHSTWLSDDHRRDAFFMGSTSLIHSGGQNRVLLCLHDITERKRLEAYHNLGSEILAILHEVGPLRELMQRVLTAMKARTGVDAVGIRLQDEDDFPYFVQEGFPKDFLLTENSLAAGGGCRNQDGTACLECTCGLVISGQTDDAEIANALVTRGGSRWINDSTALPDRPAAQNPGLNPRHQCINHGYASVALVPIRNNERICGLIQLNDRRKGCFTLETVELLEGIAAHIGEALMRKRAEEALRQSTANLHVLAARLQAVREEERATLSRELHDYFGQHLTGLQIDLMWMDRHLQTVKPPDLALLCDRIVSMVPLVERLTEQTQTICAALRPNVLYDLGLVAAIEWQVEDTAKRTGLIGTMALPTGDIELDEDFALTLFRIVQEALTNVVRHAQATHVEVRMRIDGSELTLEIQDDGRGFTQESIAGPTALGVLGMRERIGTYGGTVEFLSEPGAGATVRVRVRVPAAPEGVELGMHL